MGRLTGSKWEKVNGVEVEPPKYEKRVGRPPKSRRKQPHEVQGKHGRRMTKHGIVIHCSYCKAEGHNRNGCTARKMAMGSGSGSVNNEPTTVNEPVNEAGTVNEAAAHDQSHDVIGQEVLPSQPGLLSRINNSMLSSMFGEASLTYRPDVNQADPLPYSTFIMSNQPTARPVPLTTATKEGKRASNKRKASAPKKKTAASKKPTASKNK